MCYLLNNTAGQELCCRYLRRRWVVNFMKEEGQEITHTAGARVYSKRCLRAGGHFISVLMRAKYKKRLNTHKFYTVTLEANTSSPITSCSPKFRKG